ncbi:MAG: TadE/TadG family type IV pilus assembly protein [Sphingomonas sp.]
MTSNILAPLRYLFANKRGNVLMIFAFALIPMVFATGMGIDYSRAARLRTKLNAVADAAALAAVAQPAMNDPSDADAQATAKNMFDAQAQGLEGLDSYTLDPIKIEHPDGATSRVVTVSYTAKSVNAFGGVLNMRTINIAGTSSATATAAPNMDFYIALDTSPSMALPTTTAGISTMHTSLNCSFACHSNKIQQYVQANTIGKLPSLILDNTKFHINKPQSVAGTYGGYNTYVIDSNKTFIYNNKTKNVSSQCSDGSKTPKDICVYNADGTYVDSYWYALNQGLSLRVTDERSSVKDLMALAQNYATLNKRIYHAGVYTFDHATNFKTIIAMPNPSTASNLSAVAAAADNIDLVTVNDQAGNGRPPNGTSGTEYLFTSFKSMLDKMGGTGSTAGYLPAKSGQGSNEPGDTPQAYLFLVTDGMSDENIGLGRTRAAMQQAQVDQCNALKASPRNIKIAILYTEYTVASIQDDEPNQREIARKAIEDNPTIASRLTACASPGLMYTVKTDESISAALQALFAKAIANARLNH